MKEMGAPGGPFRVIVQDGVVLVDQFEPDIWRYYADLERELPIVRDALARLIDEGNTQFILDLRTADADSAFPIAKWGGLLGVVRRLEHQQPDVDRALLARNVKLVGNEKIFEEIELISSFAKYFERFSSVEEAKAALRRQRST